MKKRFLFSFLSACFVSACAQQNNYRLLIGTYTNAGKSEGIYAYQADLQKGVFQQQSVAKGVSNPSYLAFSADKQFVYSANENGAASSVSAFSFDALHSTFQLLNSVATQGADPCFVLASKQHVFSANYSGGSITVFGRKSNGSLTEALQMVQQQGSAMDAKSVVASHVHQVQLTPDGKFLLSTNLGTDQLTVYRYTPDATHTILVPVDSISVKKSSGPRHITITKNGKRVYVVHEIDGTLSVLGLKNGKLSLLQETSLVQRLGVKSGAADIHLSPDEKFLYATNRGTANDISCFAVKKDGTLRFVSQVATGGLGPRNFAITPDGKYVLVANQRSDNVVVFNRNVRTGILKNSGKKMELGAPVCLVFY